MAEEETEGLEELDSLLEDAGGEGEEGSGFAEELDDLLCRLFYQATSIIVKPLEPGFSGTRVLVVEPFYEKRGGGQAVVVKFGDYRKIDEEYRNFKDYVQPFIGGARSTTVLERRRTARSSSIPKTRATNQ